MMKEMLIQSPCPLSVTRAWFPLKVPAVSRVIVARRQWLLPFPDRSLARWSFRSAGSFLHFRGLKAQPRGMQRWSLRSQACATSGHTAHYITWRLSPSARCHWQPLTMKLCKGVSPNAIHVCSRCSCLMLRQRRSSPTPQGCFCSPGCFYRERTSEEHSPEHMLAFPKLLLHTAVSASSSS